MKINLEYDTVAKTLSMTQDGVATEMPHYVSFSKYEKEYEMSMEFHEEDQGNKTHTFTMVRASLADFCDKL